MIIKIIQKPITQQELNQLAEDNFGEMIKGVVDIKKRILALGGELHADAEAKLLEGGSKQEDVWGFNIYPEKPKEKRIEFSSLINIRPSQGNLAMDIKDPHLKKQVKEIIDFLIK